VVAQLIRGPGGSDAAERAQVEELARTVLATGDPKQLAAWWTYVLLHTKHPLCERMTLFWHGHFATSADKVADASLMLEQNQLFRRLALGDFRLLVHGISRDPAMLIYLDSATNRKAHANENYARELMELFCLGEGNYTEADVRELARCFTGWEIKLARFRFNPFQHDPEPKTIFGRTEPFEDGASIDWVLGQPQASRFMAGKLFHQFICDEPAPPARLIEPLALELRDHEWQVDRVVRRILSSRLFYSPHAIGRKVRSPVDVAVGLLRSLEASTNTLELAADLRQNGQGLFFPPSVKGWEGGRTWINSSTILGRANMAGRLLASRQTRFAAGTLAEYAERLGATAADRALDILDELFLARPLSASARQRLTSLYEKSPDRSRAFGSVIHAMTTLAEFQLG
jgi:uncharacterized protein (DUF1800 family)